MKKIKKALVISGGGSLGAWGGGTIQGLFEIKNKDYDIFIGSSTGSLLSPLSSIKEMDRLKEAYTSVTQKSIFNVNPFTKKGDINLLNAFWRVVKNVFTGKCATLGESENLKELIKKTFKQEDYDKLKKNEKEVIACVLNITTGKKEFKSSNEYSYEDMCEWIWASACAPVFMTLVKKEGYEYVDGGVTEHIPIQEAINKGATEIDVIIHRPMEYSDTKVYKTKNVLSLFQRISEVMHREISNDDISITNLEAKNLDVKLNLYYMPYKFTENSLLFNKARMEQWWNIGLKGIENEEKNINRYLLSRKNGLKKM